MTSQHVQKRAVMGYHAFVLISKRFSDYVLCPNVLKPCPLRVLQDSTLRCSFGFSSHIVAVVIATEQDPIKAEVARANFRDAQLDEFIDLREGDLRQTLQDVGGSIDFMLVDIWEVSCPALELVSPFLRTGAIVVCDNTTVAHDEYEDYFQFVNDPKNRFRTMTVPFKGGFELTVRV